MSLKRSLALSALLLATAPAWAQKADDMDKMFDNLSKSLTGQMDKLDKDLEAYFEQIDKQLEQSFAELERDLDNVWGKDTKLPSSKVWVGYSDQLKTRFTVDYEKGAVTIDSVDPNVSTQQLSAELARLLEQNSDDLDDKDELAKRLKKKTDAAGLGAPAARPTDKRAKELAALVNPAAPPQISTETVAGPKGQPLEVKRITVPFNADAARLNAERLRDPVTAYADNFRLPRSLVISIVKNESAFNPRAQSPIPAFGLMQLVPASGGKDAYSLVLGKKAMPTPEYLYRPVENIELGSAYLHLLSYRYLDGIKDPLSRIYCTIAGYNTGAGNVAKAFVHSGGVEAAEAAINKLTPEQVYQTLITRLPYDETRNYLVKVRRDMEAYKDWDTKRG